MHNSQCIIFSFQISTFDSINLSYLWLNLFRITFETSSENIRSDTSRYLDKIICVNLCHLWVLIHSPTDSTDFHGFSRNKFSDFQILNFSDSKNILANARVRVDKIICVNLCHLWVLIYSPTDSTDFHGFSRNKFSDFQILNFSDSKNIRTDTSQYEEVKNILTLSRTVLSRI